MSSESRIVRTPALYRAPTCVNHQKTAFPTHCHTTTCNAPKREQFRIRVVFGELSIFWASQPRIVFTQTSEVRASGVFLYPAELHGLGQPGVILGALCSFSARGVVLVFARSSGRFRANSQTLSLNGVRRFTNSLILQFRFFLGLLVVKTNHSPKEVAAVNLGATFSCRPPIPAERYVFWPPFIPEDKALLGSTLSAEPGAKTEDHVGQPVPRLSRRVFPLRDWHESKKSKQQHPFFNRLKDPDRAICPPGVPRQCGCQCGCLYEPQPSVPGPRLGCSLGFRHPRRSAHKRPRPISW